MTSRTSRTSPDRSPPLPSPLQHLRSIASAGIGAILEGAHLPPEVASDLKASKNSKAAGDWRTSGVDSIAVMLNRVKKARNSGAILRAILRATRRNSLTGYRPLQAAPCKSVLEDAHAELYAMVSEDAKAKADAGSPTPTAVSGSAVAVATPRAWSPTKYVVA